MHSYISLDSRFENLEIYWAVHNFVLIIIKCLFPHILWHANLASEQIFSVRRSCALAEVSLDPGQHLLPGPAGARALRCSKYMMYSCSVWILVAAAAALLSRSATQAPRSQSVQYLRILLAFLTCSHSSCTWAEKPARANTRRESLLRDACTGQTKAFQFSGLILIVK